ncbi:MAG: 2-oxoglutarate dehydrogenase complex dihydrolipoyllysine-residue succinyltransferase [Desulfobacterales bacterium]|nr:2-oxoglutarate dehydrogenase complex dihydrolipoyllysine-residue succinyltransferase [Desulfobacterales bacterium]
MQIEVKVPSVGESVQEAVIAEWFKQDGDAVKKGEPLFVIETDKVTLEVEAEAAGTLSIQVGEGETVAIGQVVAVIDTEAAGAGEGKKEAEEKPEAPKEPEKEKAAQEGGEDKKAPKKEGRQEKGLEEPVKEKKKEPRAEAGEPESSQDVQRLLSPAVRRLIEEKDLDPGDITGTGPGGRITKADVLLFLEGAASEKEERRPEKEAEETPAAEAGIRRKKMSPIRQRIAARLLEARQNTAMLTTFNEIDMSRAMAIRSRYKEPFQKQYNISLGFMSFFIKACVEALKEFPEINAYIEGKDIVYHDYFNIGVAVGSDRGLVVPVIRNAEKKSFAGLEKAIVDFVEKIKKNRLDLSDLEDGTFTITNGGVFGSLLSTPILNTPQSGILGMHKIEKRPVVVDDQVVIRPMMYVALSYDHRVVDGKEAVTFLRRIKEFIEDPERMLLEI